MNNVDVRYKTITGTVIGVVLANVAVAMRFTARRVGRIKLTVDDYLMVIALLFHWGIAMAGVALLYHGLGVPLSQTSPQSLIIFLKTQYTGSLLYPLCVAFTKFSILYMYWRVFQCREVRILTAFGFAVIAMWTIAVCITGALACIPVQKMWSQIEGTCINLEAFYYGIQIPNILTDIYIIIIPIHEIIQLDLPVGQKISLIGIFGLAGLTVIFDIVRLVTLIELNKSTQDVTIAVVDATVWTCIEPAIGILAACFSNCRPLYTWTNKKAHSYREKLHSQSITQNDQQTSIDTTPRPISRHIDPLRSNMTLTSVGTQLWASNDVESRVILSGPFSKPPESCQDSCEGTEGQVV